MSIPKTNNSTKRKRSKFNKVLISIFILLNILLALGCASIFNNSVVTVTCNGVNQSYTPPVNNVQQRFIPIGLFVLNICLLIGYIKINKPLLAIIITVVILVSIAYVAIVAIGTAFGGIAGDVVQCVVPGVHNP